MSTYICEYFNLYTNENFFKFANTCLIIIYFIGNLGFLYLGIKEKEYLYFTISSIMFILTIKTLYVFFNLNISQMYKMIITSSLGYLALLTIISGSFVELVMYISKVKNLNKNLKVFYNLSDNSKHSFLLICNKKGEVLYANDKFKNNYKEFATKCNYDENNCEILKDPFKILRPNDEINKIKVDLYSSGQWRGVLNIDNDNIYIDCCVQLLDPLDKDSLVSVSYINIFQSNSVYLTDNNSIRSFRHHNVFNGNIADGHFRQSVEEHGTSRTSANNIGNMNIAESRCFFCHRRNGSFHTAQQIFFRFFILKARK